MSKFEYDPEKILESIIEVEKNFPVNEWKINGVHFWPYIRTSLAYTQRLELKPLPRGESKNRYAKVLSDYGQTLFVLPIHVFRFIRKIKSARRLFAGANTHRINIKGTLYNKYFDAALADFNKRDDDSIILDRGTSLKKVRYANNDKWFSLPSLYVLCEVLKRLRLAEKNAYDIELSGYDEFFNHLITRFKNVDNLKSGFSKSAIRRKMISFHDRKEFLRRILKKSKTTKAYFLCYYTSLFYPLLAACNELKIDTIDVQHGGMGSGHWSYDRWTNVPENGYALLPRYFWSWDENSANLINRWAQLNGSHKAINMGTPWTSDYLSLTQYNPAEKNYILFNMADVKIESFVAETIRHFKERKWVLRMHPRQMQKRNILEQQIVKYGLGENVSIEDSTRVLLRDSLQFCSAFISTSSGSIIEAIQVGLTPILLPSPGENYYKDYISLNKIMPLSIQSAEKLISLIHHTMKDKAANDKADIASYQNVFLDFESQLKSARK
jgi:hypothetical protein